MPPFVRAIASSFLDLYAHLTRPTLLQQASSAIQALEACSADQDAFSDLYNVTLGLRTLLPAHAYLAGPLTTTAHVYALRTTIGQTNQTTAAQHLTVALLAASSVCRREGTRHKQDRLDAAQVIWKHAPALARTDASTAAVLLTETICINPEKAVTEITKLRRTKGDYALIPFLREVARGPLYANPWGRPHEDARLDPLNGKPMAAFGVTEADYAQAKLAHAHAKQGLPAPKVPSRSEALQFVRHHAERYPLPSAE